MCHIPEAQADSHIHDAEERSHHLICMILRIGKYIYKEQDDQARRQEGDVKMIKALTVHMSEPDRHIPEHRPGIGCGGQTVRPLLSDLYRAKQLEHPDQRDGKHRQEKQRSSHMIHQKRNRNQHNSAYEPCYKHCSFLFSPYGALLPAGCPPPLRSARRNGGFSADKLPLPSPDPFWKSPAMEHR